VKPRGWIVFGVIVVFVLGGLLLAANPRIGCQITLGPGFHRARSTTEISAKPTIRC
jgi:hypothetical protein